MRGLVIIRHEAVQRNIVGTILTSLEEKGFKLVAIKMVTARRDQAEALYAHLKDKPFYEGILQCMMDGPFIAIAVEMPPGIDLYASLTQWKGISGLRGRFATHASRNVIHGSSSAQDAQREVSLFFSDDEICAYTKAVDAWLGEGTQ